MNGINEMNYFSRSSQSSQMLFSAKISLFLLVDILSILRAIVNTFLEFCFNLKRKMIQVEQMKYDCKLLFPFRTSFKINFNKKTNLQLKFYRFISNY